MPTRTTPNSTTVQRFQNLSAGEFHQQIDDLQTSQQRVIDTVKTLVEEEMISPLQGVGIIGCAASQLYGVQAFHGQPSYADLWTLSKSSSQ